MFGKATFTVNQDLTVETASAEQTDTNGTITGAGNMIVASEFTYKDGLWDGFGFMDVRPGAKLNFEVSQGQTTHVKRSIRNNGSLLINSPSDVNFMQGANINNLDGVMTFKKAFFNDSGGMIINYGTIKFTIPSRTNFLYLPIVNYGGIIDTEENKAKLGGVYLDAGTFLVGASETILDGGSNGVLTEAADGVMLFKLGGTNAVPGTDHGQVVANGAGQVIALEGALALELLSSLSVDLDTVFTIIKNETGNDIDGTFAGLPEGTSIAVADWVFRISYVGGYSEQDVTLTVIARPSPPLYTLEGRVWHDDGNGIYEDEPGVDGIEVKLISGGVEIATAITANGGVYQFVDLPEGNYQVEIASSGNYQLVPMDQGSEEVDSDFNLSNYLADILLSGIAIRLGDAGLMFGTSASLNSSNSNAVFGEVLTLSATVTGNPGSSGTPGGTVEFFEGATSLGSAPLVDGLAQLEISTLGVGSHTITAAYSGGPGFVAGPLGELSQNVRDFTNPLPEPVTVNAGSEMTFDANATDPENGNIEYSLIGGPSGAVINSVSGEFAWAPTNGQGGVHTFLVRVTWADFTTTDREVTINVRAFENPLPNGMTVNANTEATFQAVGYDPTNGSVSYSLIDSPFGEAGIDGNGLFSWTPSSENLGTWNFTVRVTWSDNSWTDQAVSVTVQ